MTEVASPPHLPISEPLLEPRISRYDELEYELRVDKEVAPQENYLELRPHTPAISERAGDLGIESLKEQAATLKH